MTEHAGSCTLAMKRCGGGTNLQSCCPKHNQQQFLPLLLRFKRLSGKAERDSSAEHKDEGEGQVTNRLSLECVHWPCMVYDDTRPLRGRGYGMTTRQANQGSHSYTCAYVHIHICHVTEPHHVRTYSSCDISLRTANGRKRLPSRARGGVRTRARSTGRRRAR
jgi:hypothetical protein